MKGRFYRDPVCGMKINRQKAQALIKHKGYGYYLCCPLCQEEFEQNPDKYAKPEYSYELPEKEKKKGKRNR